MVSELLQDLGGRSELKSLGDKERASGSMDAGINSDSEQIMNKALSLIRAPHERESSQRLALWVQMSSS